MASGTLLGHVGQAHGEYRDVESSQGESTIALACNECRRRKARVGDPKLEMAMERKTDCLKCSRELPVCSQCLQYRRHCLYERATRSPLTRK
jgi:hypothetical protein